jgi:type VI secretion system protein ImpL
VAARRLTELASTQNSERILADYRGSWSLIRLLEQAEITQLDSSSYKVQWRAPDGLPLHYLMRVEQGKGRWHCWR